MLLGTQRGICLGWKSTGTGCSRKARSFLKSLVAGILPPLPQRSCPKVGLLELEEYGQRSVWRLLLGGSLPSSPSLVCRAGPIASPLEPLLLALQPAGPLEEGLSLFFNKLLTISPSQAFL